VSEVGLVEIVLCLFSIVVLPSRRVLGFVFVKIFTGNTSLMILMSGELSGYYSKGSVHECR
jgi:hypothetical protein